jgi:hypothetical protein
MPQKTPRAFAPSKVLKSSITVSKSPRAAATGYTNYSGCSDTVAANSLGMSCRIYHLGVAAMAGTAAEHCFHAAQDATGHCAIEGLT